MKPANGGYTVDLSSRYFTEDFPFGLCILRGFGEIAGVKTPHMDKILSWYESIAGVHYLKDSVLCGADCAQTAIPQRFSLVRADDLYAFYQTSIV